MHKGEFKDALCLYLWLAQRLPGTLNVAPPSQSTRLLINCPKGAFPFIGHKELKDLAGNILAEVCHGVTIEPVLQPL